MVPVPSHYGAFAFPAHAQVSGDALSRINAKASSKESFYALLSLPLKQGACERVRQVTDVPHRNAVTKDLLARAGYTFGESHYVTKVTRESPPDLVARIRAAQGQRISYEALMQQAKPAPLVGDLAT